MEIELSGVEDGFCVYVMMMMMGFFRVFQEEVAKLQRKLERSQKIEQAGAADEVLLEEIKEYKVRTHQTLWAWLGLSHVGFGLVK